MRRHPATLAAFFLCASFFLATPLGAAESYPLTLVREQCIGLPGITVGAGPQDVRDCAVSEFDRFPTLEGVEYDYALYCLIPGYAEEGSSCRSDEFSASYHRTRGLAVFSRAPEAEDLTLLWTRADPEVGLLIYARPELIENTFGTLLILPIRLDGTGGGNESEYYLRQGDAWRRLDSQSWLEELSKRIPEELGIWHGVWPDLRTMTATTGLYRANDASCCPTGGELQIRLEVRDDRLAIRELAIVPPAGEPPH